MKRILPGAFVVLLVVFFSSCMSQPKVAAPRPPVLLISMDAFRWDYIALHPAETPHLRALMQSGISAKSLIPAFPSNTFPNHYSIATGLYPSHHGIIDNNMYDPVLGELFHYSRDASNADSRWWGGEPIWITAVKQGKPSACFIWPGSEALIKGVRATRWQVYNYTKITFEQRLDDLVHWLTLPPDQRPVVSLFYLEETNSIGHKFGPNSPRLVETLKLMDDRIGAMLARFKAEGITVNLVIVSDHGMAEISEQRVGTIEDYVDTKRVQIDFDGPVSGLRPLDGNVDALMNDLKRLPPQFKAYRAEDLPARFHVDPKSSPRVPPVWVLPDEGWQFLSRAKVISYKGKFNKGDHGYDPISANMHGIFIANGPSFKNDGSVIPSVENVNIYNLLCAATGLTPAPNDGDDRLVRAVMKK